MYMASGWGSKTCWRCVCARVEKTLAARKQRGAETHGYLEGAVHREGARVRGDHLQQRPAGQDDRVGRALRVAVDVQELLRAGVWAAVHGRGIVGPGAVQELGDPHPQAVDLAQDLAKAGGGQRLHRRAGVAFLQQRGRGRRLRPAHSVGQPVGPRRRGGRTAALTDTAAVGDDASHRPCLDRSSHKPRVWEGEGSATLGCGGAGEVRTRVMSGGPGKSKGWL